MELKWLKATTYSQGIGYVIGLIRRELIALQPLDSPDISWDRTAEGVKARLVKNNPADVSSRAPDSGEIAEEGGGEGKLVVMTVRPNGGYGPAIYKLIELSSDGNWQATGSNVPTVVPKQT